MVARSQPQQALDDYAATKEDQQVGSAPYDTMTSRPVPSTSCYQATTARPQRSEQGTGLPRDEQPDPCAPHASAWSSLLATQASHAGRASPVRPPQLPINPTLGDLVIGAMAAGESRWSSRHASSTRRPSPSLPTKRSRRMQPSAPRPSCTGAFPFPSTRLVKGEDDCGALVVTC